MSNSLITFRGIAPIYSPLSLHLGVDQFSRSFTQALKAINLQTAVDQNGAQTPLDWQGQLFHLGGEQEETRQYQSTGKNSKDIRLMCWSPQDKSNIIFHVFTNHIAIAEVEFTLDVAALNEQAGSTDALIELIEDRVQHLAKAQVESYLDDFCHDLKQLKLHLSADFIYADANNVESGDWVARTMLVNDDLLKQQGMATLLTSWLKKTSRPQDAQDILENKKNYSMTWLNYVVKNPKPPGQDPNIQIMVLAQYYYVSQENSNSALRGAIEDAYSRSKKPKTDKVLASTRTACRLNQVTFYENIKFLNRPNRALLEDILNGWKFNQLVENSERMIEVCNARLQEEDNKRRERSTVMTDFLLVALSFFTVFELSLYLTEFSREMMSRPALDYNDSKSSLFLSVIAEVDADIMFSLGFGLTLLLIIVYRHIKRN